MLCYEPTFEQVRHRLALSHPASFSSLDVWTLVHAIALDTEGPGREAAAARFPDFLENLAACIAGFKVYDSLVADLRRAAACSRTVRDNLKATCAAQVGCKSVHATCIRDFQTSLSKQVQALEKEARSMRSKACSAGTCA